MIWFGWVLRQINHCRLFNTKSSLYIYIKYIWFGFVGFYGISSIVGYLMSNPLYKYHHHHHVALVARISLTLSRHSSLSFIAQGRSSGHHPVSSHSCWMYVRAGRSAFARPCVGIHKSTSLMSSSLLLQQCPACLYVWFVDLVGFYGISTIVGYLMPNPLYTYILNIYDLVWFGFMADQPL